MKDYKRAAILWIPKDRGGREKPPLGVGDPSYSTVVHFSDEPWPQPHGSWSLAILKDEAQSDEYRWIADVRFVSEAAPSAVLRDGREFELFEGNKCVACGSVIGDAPSTGSRERILKIGQGG